MFLKPGPSARAPVSLLGLAGVPSWRSLGEHQLMPANPDRSIRLRARRANEFPRPTLANPGRSIRLRARRADELGKPRQKNQTETTRGSFILRNSTAIFHVFFFVSQLKNVCCRRNNQSSVKSNPGPRMIWRYYSL